MNIFIGNILILLFFIISSIIFIILYLLAPNSYLKINFNELNEEGQKEILIFLYNSYTSKLPMYHEALIGCVFGIFSIIVLLSQDYIQHFIKVLILYLGFAFVGLSMIIFSFTMVYYAALQVVEKSYKINSAKSHTIREYVYARAHGYQ